jgi:putative FmdB family regulatory protein
MPIYEYECRACGAQFERLVRTNDVVTCPSCAGPDVERLLSMFAVQSAGTRSLALKDGRKRSARMRQEREHAEHEHEKSHSH